MSRRVLFRHVRALHAPAASYILDNFYRQDLKRKQYEALSLGTHCRAHNDDNFLQ